MRSEGERRYENHDAHLFLQFRSVMQAEEHSKWTDGSTDLIQSLCRAKPGLSRGCIASSRTDGVSMHCRGITLRTFLIKKKKKRKRDKERKIRNK